MDYGTQQMVYSPEQIAALQKYAATGQGGEQLPGMFGSPDQINQAKNWAGSGGAGYDPAAIANSYRANSPQGSYLQQMGWVDAQGNPSAAGLAGGNPLTGRANTPGSAGDMAIRMMQTGATVGAPPSIAQTTPSASSTAVSGLANLSPVNPGAQQTMVNPNAVNQALPAGAGLSGAVQPVAPTQPGTTQASGVGLSGAFSPVTPASGVLPTQTDQFGVGSGLSGTGAFGSFGTPGSGVNSGQTSSPMNNLYTQAGQRKVVQPIVRSTGFASASSR